MSNTQETAALGSATGYQNAHRALREVKGRASLYDCANSLCGERAYEWSFCGKPSEALRVRSGPAPLLYSLDMGDYQPLCRSCRKRLGSHCKRRPVRDDELETLTSQRKMEGVPRLPVRWDAEIEAWAA